MHPFDSISTLSDFKNAKCCNFMFNGQILVPSFSFAFYGIKNEDSIIVVPKQQVSNKIINQTTNKKPTHSRSPSLYQVKAISLQMYELYGTKPDSDTINDIIRQLSDLDYGNEAGRLRDLLYGKIDGNFSSYQKLVRRYQTLNQYVSNKSKLTFSTEQSST